jgi:Putative auto-transporter adhesin, head GIN domain
MRVSGFVVSVGLVAGSVVLAGCDTQAQEQQSQTRDLSGFAGIAASGGIDLKLQQGDDFLVEVTGADADDVITEVQDGTLVIRRQGHKSLFGWWAGASATVRLPVLESLAASGGSDVKAAGQFNSERLDVIASGGSDVEISVAVTSLNVEASGGSDFDLSGTADTAILRASGGSDLNGRNFRAREVQLHTSGGSDSIFGVDERLSGDASGGSDITYIGNPGTVEVDTSGSSDIRRR